MGLNVRSPKLAHSHLPKQILVATAIIAGAISSPVPTHPAIAQTPTSAGQALTLRSDIQEANAVTGVITARGNVQINYPARQIQATSVQAQYYSRERRIVLSGNVYVLQNGNSLRGETITYLIDEGRFVAVPDGAQQQVEAIYIVPDPNPPVAPNATVTTVTPSDASAQPSSDFNPKPEFKTPISPPTSP
ncbi:MAG: LptA/OstA family protein [Oculatellaceae cyanobacterium bins.114]|nr:LptA/OstA family protein [Oculatellaceae cyanobacterium bins.114]